MLQQVGLQRGASQQLPSQAHWWVLLLLLHPYAAPDIFLFVGRVYLLAAYPHRAVEHVHAPNTTSGSCREDPVARHIVLSGWRRVCVCVCQGSECFCAHILQVQPAPQARSLMQGVVGMCRSIWLAAILLAYRAGLFCGTRGWLLRVSVVRIDPGGAIQGACVVRCAACVIDCMRRRFPARGQLSQADV